MVWHHEVILDPQWNRFAIQVFVGLTLLPVAFAFSVRFLPLYLRLESPAWPVRETAYVYLLGWAVETLPALPPLAQALPRMTFVGTQVGMGIKGLVVVWIVWQLGVLSYMKPKPPRSQPSDAASAPPKARPGLPPRHLFGRFDWLIFTAYSWLVLGAAGEIVIGVTNLAGVALGISPDAIRHLYLLGFVSLLIFGVGVRLLPGLLHTRRIASPRLVEATFWVGNAAVLSRILLVGIPPRVWQAMPGVVGEIRVAFAFSGILGMIAVGCLWINLRQTANGSVETVA